MIEINNLYYYYTDPNNPIAEYYYLINGVAYYAETLQHVREPLETIYNENNHFDPFTISSNGSQILIVSSSQVDIPYQQLSTGRFVELTGRIPIQNSIYVGIFIFRVPLPGGQEINEVFEKLSLSRIDNEFIDRILNNYQEGETLTQDSYDDILELINEPPFPRRNFTGEPTIEQLERFGRSYIERILLSREGGVLRRELAANVHEIEREIEDIRNPPVPHNVYIHNVNPRTSPRDLANLFNDVDMVRLIDDVYIITFTNEENANDALNLNGILLDGNIIRVTREEPQTVIEHQPPDNLTKESHAMYMSQVYGLPVVLPEFLIINGLRINFISFQEVVDMLNQNQIERYILDPVLQPWAGLPSSPNRIITMFNNNGITYLVKARYDQVTNQIFQPV